MLSKYYEEIVVGQEDMYYLVRTYVWKTKIWTPWVRLDGKVAVPLSFDEVRGRAILDKNKAVLVKSRGRFVKLGRNILGKTIFGQYRQSLYEVEMISESDSVCLKVKDGSTEFIDEKVLDRARAKLDRIRVVREINLEAIRGVWNGEV